MLPSATTLTIICWRDYALTMYAMQKQLPSQNQVCLALDGWISRNKLTIPSIIAYYIDRNWALHEVQLTTNVVVHLLSSDRESWFQIIRPGVSARTPMLGTIRI